MTIKKQVEPVRPVGVVDTVALSQSGMRRRFLLQGGLLAAAGMGALTLSPGRIFAATPRELRVGNQKGLLSLLKGRGTLEKRLAPLGVTVKWIEFVAGPVQLEALIDPAE